MRNIFLMILLSSLYLSSFGQKMHGVIELNPYIRYDTYPEFSDTGNPLSGNYTNLKGVSYGINANYKRAIKNEYKLLIGLGYYKQIFNKIEIRNTRRSDEVNVRVIGYPSPLYMLFYTDKYWYNCIANNIGIEKDINLKNDLLISIVVSANNYFTYSQYYHLINNPEGSLDYKKKEFKYLGLSVTSQISIQKRINSISIGPNLILPLFDIWRTDDTFPYEASSGSRSKWLRGIGFGISINYSLSQKNKL